MSDLDQLIADIKVRIAKREADPEIMTNKWEKPGYAIREAHHDLQILFNYLTAEGLCASTFTAKN